MDDVLIIGGGFSGTCAAIHLLRQGERKLDIVLVEPAAQLGGGLAHSTADPDHRLNAPVSVHVVIPDVPDHLETWLRTGGRTERDAEGMHDGLLYPRRSDFGAYMRAQLEHAARESISSLRHVQDHAVGIERAGGKYRVSLASGAQLEAHACIVASGHERPLPPAFVSESAAKSARYFNDPWDANALASIDRHWEVLLIGAALTAADVIATLARRGHAGSLTAISRHGYQPAGQNPSRSSRSLWDAVNDPLPDFVARHGKPMRVAEIMRRLRTNIEEQESQGRTWHSAFDEVRNAARHLWAALPVQEKRRFQRHVRARYDPHRFRIPPQTERIVSERLASGQLTAVAGRIGSIDASDAGLEVAYRDRNSADAVRRKRFDAVINCTGPEINLRRSQNPLLRSLLDAGLACEGEAGIGVAVDNSCQALDRSAQPLPGLYFIGPLTRSLFGETPAVPLITWEVLRLLPHLLAHS
jgi:uncharacterized NAD(P)/FAD-binding protein YdhS